MRHLSHQVTVTSASTTASSVDVSMVVRPSVTSTNNSKFITTDETPLDLTLRKCSEKFVERRYIS